MYSFLESFRLAFNSIRAHAMRSVLTTLGILIGVAATIGVVAIGQGMSHAIGSQFEGLGAQNVTIRAETSRMDQLQGKINRLTLTDYELLKSRLSGVSNITPVLFVGNAFGQARYKNNETVTQVFGTTSTYQDVNNSYPQEGRFLTISDDRANRKICVIGSKLIEDLKLPADPIGDYLEIGSEWFKIVGVMESRGEIFGFSQDNYIMIPVGAAAALNGWSQNQNVQISMTIDDLAKFEEVKAYARLLLRQSHGLKAGDADTFRIETAQQIGDTFEQIMNTLTVVMSGIVGISLLVGGIGIMNIMLVSVTERTREIGICKAVGAKRHHILLQFLIEAVVLSLFGGLLGVGFGYLIGFAIASAFPVFPDALVPWWAVTLALGFSIMVGVVFGIAPAAKAARLDPIEALRHE